MKLYVVKLFLSIFIVGIIMSQTVSAQNERNEKKRITLKTMTKCIVTDRSFDADIKAYFCPETRMIEIICFDTKEITIYIVDSEGEEIFYESHISDIMPYYLDIPQATGIYWLIIDSPVLYGEGMFEVK